MEPKKVDTKEYKLDPFARPKDEVFEYTRINPINEELRGNRNTLFLKRSFYSYDIHIREMLGYLLAKECNIPACEVEIAIYPMLHGHFEDAIISYPEVSKNDQLIMPREIVKEYRKSVGIDNKKDWVLDIESILNSVFGMMNKNGRPQEEYNKFLQDFINMMIYDIKFINSDRDYKNWYIRKNLVTNEIDLYPLFDNASVFASERDPIPNITEEQVKDLNENHPVLLVRPQDFRDNKEETNYKEMLEYLLLKYPKQTISALEKVSVIDSKRLEELIDSIPGVDETRKNQMLKVFEERERGVREIYNRVIESNKYRS